MKKHFSLEQAALFYIATPFALFLAFWFAAPFNILFEVLFLYGLSRAFGEKNNSHASQKKYFSKKDLWTIAIIALIAAFLAGIGGYTTQQNDWRRSNFIFDSLAHQPWPLEYKFTDGQTIHLVYFLGFYLFPGLVGALTNQSVMDFAIFLWGTLGVALGLLIFARHFRLPSWASLLFLGFGGLSCIGHVIHHHHPMFSWWAAPLRYVPPSSPLTWSPHYILAALIPGLLMLRAFENRKIYQAIAWLCLSFFWHPFVTLGLLPYFLWEARKDILRLFTLPSLSLGLGIALPLLILYSTKITPEVLTCLLFIPGALNNYPLFILWEVGVWFLFLKRQDFLRPQLLITLAILVLTPFFALGAAFDWCFRIPLFAQVFLAGTLIHHFTRATSPKWKICFAFVFALGFLSVLNECFIERTLDGNHWAVFSPKCRHEYREFLQTLNIDILQYLGSRQENAWGQMFLAKSPQPALMDRSWEVARMRLQVANGHMAYDTSARDATPFIEMAPPFYLLFENPGPARRVYISFDLKSDAQALVPLTFVWRKMIEPEASIHFKTLYEILRAGYWQYYEKGVQHPVYLWSTTQYTSLPASTSSRATPFVLSLAVPAGDYAITLDIDHTKDAPLAHLRMEHLQMNLSQPNIPHATQILW